VSVIRTVPLVIDQAGHRLDYRTDNVPAIVWCEARPAIAVIVAPQWGDIQLTVDGLANGLVGEWVEPFGDITIRPLHDKGADWLVVDLDGKGQPGAHLIAYAPRVAEFVADVTVAAILAGIRPACRDWEQELPGPLRTDDGAA
jgi:hypothetical protein